MFSGWLFGQVCRDTVTLGGGGGCLDRYSGILSCLGVAVWTGMLSCFGGGCLDRYVGILSCFWEAV